MISLTCRLFFAMIILTVGQNSQKMHPCNRTDGTPYNYEDTGILGSNNYAQFNRLCDNNKLNRCLETLKNKILDQYPESDPCCLVNYDLNRDFKGKCPIPFHITKKPTKLENSPIFCCILNAIDVIPRSQRNALLNNVHYDCQKKYIGG